MLLTLLVIELSTHLKTATMYVSIYGNLFANKEVICFISLFNYFSSSCQELFDNFIGAVNTILEKLNKFRWRVDGVHFWKFGGFLKVEIKKFEILYIRNFQKIR